MATQDEINDLSHQDKELDKLYDTSKHIKYISLKVGSELDKQSNTISSIQNKTIDLNDDIGLKNKTLTIMNKKNNCCALYIYWIIIGMEILIALAIIVSFFFK